MPLRLLIIDPDIRFVVGVKRALEETGEFTVNVSANGLAAVDALRQQPHDAAIVAFDVPEMDIVELIARLRLIQSHLPIIVTPKTRDQQDRVEWLDAQGALEKPYTARSLMAYVRRTLDRMRIAPAGDEPTPAQTESPEQARPDQPYENLLAEFEALEAMERQRQDSAQTAHLPELEAPPETDRLPDTEPLADLLHEQGWLDQSPLIPEADFPVAPDDTPSSPQPPSADFGAVLDAIAQTPGDAPADSEDDQAFRELVESMRSPTPRGHNRLEELLASIAADISRQADEAPPSPDNTLDYVLHAIRQGTSPGTGINAERSGVSELDDATIGDVISGLFDPSFEGVLAALSGQDVGDDFEEPSYAAAQEGRPPDLPEADRLPGGAEGRSARGPVIEEPPYDEGDSSSYPATAALNAISSLDDSQASLSDLLSQIEQQLPLDQATRPRLRPLPSWQDNPLEDAAHLEAMFDRLEGPLGEETRPSQRTLDEIAESGPELPELLQADEAEDAGWHAEPVDQADARVAAELEEMFEPEYGAPQDRAEKPEAGEPIDLEELFRDEYGVAEEPAEIEEQSDMRSITDLLALAGLPTEEEYQQAEQAAQDEPVEARGESFEERLAVQAETVDAEREAADDEGLIPVPAEAVASLWGEDYDAEAEEAAGEDDELLAHIAVQLTQFALESSAQGLLLSRPGEVLAEAGDLPPQAMTRLFETVDSAWRASTVESDSLIRYVTLPEAGEFLLYSVAVEDNLFLSMAFHSGTSVRLIRRQARRLSESLAFVPENGQAEGAPYAVEDVPTRPSRPTDPRVPRELRDVLQVSAPEATAEPGEGSVPHRPPKPRPDEPYAAYTCLWLPDDAGLEMPEDFAGALVARLRDLAEDNAWTLEDVDIRADYVQITLSVPHSILPDHAVTLLMDETAPLGDDYFFNVAEDDAPFWADGYYIVTPPRDLTEREIARYITYQRQAQAG